MTSYFNGGQNKRSKPNHRNSLESTIPLPSSISQQNLAAARHVTNGASSGIGSTRCLYPSPPNLANRILASKCASNYTYQTSARITLPSLIDPIRQHNRHQQPHRRQANQPQSPAIMECSSINNNNNTTNNLANDSAARAYNNYFNNSNNTESSGGSSSCASVNGVSGQSFCQSRVGSSFPSNLSAITNKTIGLDDNCTALLGNNSAGLFLECQAAAAAFSPSPKNSGSSSYYGLNHHHHRPNHQPQQQQQQQQTFGTVNRVESDSTSSSADFALPRKPQILTESQIRMEIERQLESIGRKPPKTNFAKFYRKGKFIRAGGFSDIFHGQSCTTNDDIVLKFIPKFKTRNWLSINGVSYPTELALHKIASSTKGVLGFYDYFQEVTSWVIVIERLPRCLDLFDYMERVHRGRLCEDTARYFFKQLVRINLRLAKLGIVHRDIKSENVLVDLDNNKLVLIDFGASAILKKGAYVDFHGTRQFKPPEYVRTGRYHAEPSTVWALGVLLYDMVVGKLPYETEADIITGDLELKPFLSSSLKDLIRLCLNSKPEQRPTLRGILSSDWLAPIPRTRLMAFRNLPILSSPNPVDRVDQPPTIRSKRRSSSYEVRHKQQPQQLPSFTEYDHLGKANQSGGE